MRNFISDFSASFRSIFLLCVIGVGSTAYAVNPVPYTEAVTFSFKFTGSGAPTMWTYDQSYAENPALPVPNSTYPNPQGGTESVPATAWLIPGKSYNITFQSSSLNQYWMSFIAPTGYEVLIDGASMDLYTSALNATAAAVNDPHTIQIRPLAQMMRMNAAAFSGFDIGKSISWSVGLGGLHSGHSAGQILYRQQDLALGPPTNDSPASRDRLIYVAPIYPATMTSQITVIRDGPSNQILRQIVAPQSIIDLVDDVPGANVGYVLKFYDPLLGTAHGVNQPYTFSGQPWRTIHVQSPSGGGTMTVTETEGTVSRVSTLALTSGTVASGTYVLTLQMGDGTTWLQTSTHSSTNNGDGTRDDVVAVRTGGAAGTIVAKTRYHYVDFNWGEQTTQVVTDPDVAALTTTFTYGTSGLALGNYTRVLSVTNPTGKWSATAYYDDWARRGGIKTSFLPFNNSPSTPTTDPAQGVVTNYDYVADWTGRFTRPASQTVAIKNSAAGETLWTYDPAADPAWSLPRDKADVDSFSSSSASLRSRIETVSSQSGSPDDMGEAYLIKNADQTQESFSRSSGTYSAGTFTVSATGTFWRELTVNGSTSSAGAEQISSYNSQNFDPIYLIANKSTLEVTVRDPAGNSLTSSGFVYQAGNVWAAVNSTTNTYDVAGRLTQSTSSNGATATNTVTNGQVVKSVDATGIETDYTYDVLGRVFTTVKKGVVASGSYLAQPDVTTTNTYDGVGHVTQQVLGTNGSSETLTATISYDYSGRMTSQTPAGMGTTNVAYDPIARTVTATAPPTLTIPGGSQSGTTVKTYQIDGQVASIGGTGVIAQTYVYDFDSTLSQRTVQVYSGNNGTLSPRVQQAWTDWLGRTVKAQKSAFSQNTPQSYVEQSTYDPTTGLLNKKTPTGSAPTIYVYNTLAQLTRTGLDVNANGLVLASNDRIIDQDTSFYKDGSNNWWGQTTTTSYPFSGLSTAVVAKITRSRLSGFSGNIQAESVAIDAEGNSTDAVTTVVPSSHLVTTTVTAPGLVNSGASVSYNGLNVAQTGADNLTTYIQYDALLRPWKSIDTRNNATVAAYITNTSLVQTMTDAAANPVTTNTYDGNGRIVTAANALGKFTRTAYDVLGRVTNVWGAATNPISYAFDPTYGDKISQSTYRNAPATDSTVWPAVGVADTTSWTLDAASGLVWKKTDAAGHFVQFDYTALGQLASRQWARALINSSGNVTTLYGYDPNTAELTSTSYSDTAETIPTPPVTNTYTRSGQLQTIIDGSGMRTFAYDGTMPWRLNSETLPSYYGSPSSSTRVISRLYQAATSSSAGSYGAFTLGTVKGRAVGFDLGNGSNATADLQQIYSCSNLGQFAGMTSQVGAAAPQTFLYSYIANSELLNGYTVGSNFSVARSYEPQRDLVTSIQSSWGSTTTLSRYDFTYDALGRRMTCKLSGNAYLDYFKNMSYSSVYDLYGYNDRNELQTAAMYPGDTVSLTPSAPEFPGHRFEYRYDSIGNRITAGETGKSVANGGTDESYTANSLNQYTAKDNLTVRIIGTAAAGAHVAVAGAPSTGKSDRAWGADVVAANSSAAVQGTLTAYTGLIGQGTGGKDIINSASKSFFIPQQTQAFSYDNDGNLTGDTLWNYTYNAENQLVRMSSALPSGFGYTRLQLNFTYDYLGRRIAKTVIDLNASTTILSRRFIYDGWNLIAELDGTGTNLVRSYTWGLDLTGDLTRAGGVGALVQMYDYASSETFWPTYDSNGNVGSLVNASTGAFAAVYEYDPYGNYLQAKVTDTVVQDNPWRYSSKYADLETSLVYYGHRYYSPSMGRFINKDPIEESGGLNLYGYCGNNGVNRYDVLGFIPRWVPDYKEGGSDQMDAQGRVISHPGTGHYVDDGIGPTIALDKFVVNGDRDAPPPSTSFDDYSKNLILNALPTALQNVWGGASDYAVTNIPIGGSGAPSGSNVVLVNNKPRGTVVSTPAPTFKAPNSSGGYGSRFLDGVYTGAGGLARSLVSIPGLSELQRSASIFSYPGGIIAGIKAQQAADQAAVKNLVMTPEGHGTLALNLAVILLTKKFVGVENPAIQVGNYTLSDTVAQAMSKRIGGTGEYSGQLVRPYLSSPSTIEEIISTGNGVPDPQGVPGLIRYDVPGAFRGSSGTWELLHDPATDTIFHFNFTN